MPTVVLITGGSSGLGEAIASHLARFARYKVYATSRHSSFGENRNGVIFLPLDLTQSHSIEQAAHWMREKEGRVDVLINNAGVGFAGPLIHTTRSEIHAVMETNLYGVLDVCSSFFTLLPQPGGKIIQISSLAGRFGLPFRGVYSSSKFALEGLTESLSQELSQFGISVVLVEPGDFNTQISQNRGRSEVPPESPFSHQFERTYEMINDEVARSYPAAYLAAKLEPIIRNPRPRLRYVIGSPFQRFTLILKALLPQRLFERLINHHYQIPNP